MKTILTLLVGLGAWCVVAGCQNPSTTRDGADMATTASVETTLQPVTLAVTGMT